MTKRSRQFAARSSWIAVVVAGLLPAVLVLPGSSVANAEELTELYRGARQSAMGNAFVAIADDEAAIFMNPAGLAGIRGSTFHYAVADIQLSSESITSLPEVMSAFSDFNSDSFDALMGKDIYARAQITPSLVTENLGIAILVDQQVGLAAENPAIPDIDLLYQTTNGVQVAYGVSLFGGNRKRSVQDFRIGLGAKMLWRRGGLRQVPMIDLLTASSATIGELAGKFGRGYGFDVGFQYVRRVSRRVELMAGSAWTDIGDISFGTSGADPQPQNLSAGVGARVDMNLSKLTFAIDQRHLTADTDWRKRTHVGVELGLPIIDVYAGVNQKKLTYGAAFDLWLFRITAARYTEEIGAFADQDAVSRWMLKIALQAPL